MKKSNFYLFCGIFMSLFFGFLTPSSAQCLPSLGSASGFAIFTNSGAIDNTAISTITGNIGTNAGAIIGFESSTIIGDFFNANSITQNAALDLSSAYIAYQILTPNFTAHTPAYGSGETLTPGIYKIGAAGSIAGTLILDGQNNPNAKFILKFGGAFTAGAGATIVLINGALSNNIYWIVGGAFSLAANTTFKGTIIADGAISIGVGANLNCKLLSVAGAISTYGTLLDNSGIDNSSNKYYADADNDGYGNPDVSSCTFVAGYVLNSSDCNDADATIHPNAVEIYGNGIDDDCNGISDTDAVSCSFTTTWNGNSWVPFLPVANQHAVIAGDYTQSTDLLSCTLDVVNNAIVSVPSGTNFTISGALKVAPTATLIFNNNTNLIQTDDNALNTGNIVVKRNTSTIVRLDHTLWASPVVGQQLFTFSPATLTNRFYSFNTATSAYTNTTSNPGLYTGVSEFSPAVGYVIRAPNDQSSTVSSEWTGTFTGLPNNGSKTFSLIYNGLGSNSYNLIGNPFPSAIDAKLFTETNSNTIDGTIYFYQHTLTMNALGIFPPGTNYSCWNSSGTALASQGNGHTPNVRPNGIIQVGQGFFVKAKSSGNLNFTNAMRVADVNNQFLKSADIPEKHRLWLNLLSDTDEDINQILVGYIAGATQGFDSDYDGLLFGNTGSYLYSTINGSPYAIQGRALPFSTSDEVPLGFNCDVAGTFSIKLTGRDGLFLGDQDVFIRDNLTGTDTNIKTEPYTFTSDTGTFEDRFRVVYLQALGTPSTTFNNNSVIVYKNTDWFHVSAKGVVIKDIMVYDVSGRLIFKLNNVNNTTAVLKGLSQTKQVLFLKVISQENQSVTIKVLN